MAKDLKEQIEIMTHYLNGGKIKFKRKDINITTWTDAEFPNWNWHDFDYRIKEPKEKVTIEKWLMQSTIDKEYRIFETSLVDTVVNFNKIKLIESYEVEL